MDSPQSVVSPLKTTSVFHESDKQNEANFFDFQRKNTTRDNSDEFLGAVEVFIHKARDIHNICIYQKQDVYAKLCLTSDPEKTVSTKIINGGGRNPVFNENLSLNVRTVDSSLKCEIWMLSRVRNYLEDQLLGFALVPVSDILLHNGKLEKEFSLSSTDLFHSPAGFVELTVLYVGVQPEVILINPSTSETHDPQSMESLSSALDSIEFPDPPQVVNETNKMVEEYFAMPCDEFISEAVMSPPPPRVDSPPSVSKTNGTCSASIHVSINESCDTPKNSNTQKEELVSHSNVDESKKSSNGLDSESGASGSDMFVKPVVSVEIEPEPKVVQQDIVDMYMKSMQQFTESLAKMKLPMEMESGPTSTESSVSSEQKTPSSKNSSGSRVFYGSRAFF